MSAFRRLQHGLERHGWTVILALILVLGVFGALDLAGGAGDLQNGEAVLMHSLTDTSWNDLQVADQGAARLVDWKYRSDGATLLALAVLGAAVCLTGLRRGERWAWLVLWTLPAWAAVTVVSVLLAIRHPGYGTPVPVISGAVLFAIWCVVLALSSPRYLRQRLSPRPK